MSSIVGVQFEDRANPGEFCGREYSYFAGLDLAVGDVVVVPTVRGDGIARVSRIDVPESKVDERILPSLKTIERLYEPENKTEEELTCQQQ